MDFIKFFESTSAIDINTLHEEILKFTLSLYNNPLLSRKAVESVIEVFNNFISKLSIPFFQSEIENQFKCKINDALRAQVHFILENGKNIFKKYSTEHLRFKMYEEKTSYIPPELYSVEGVSIVYVSLKETLTKIFSMPNMLEEVSRYINDLSKYTSSLSNIIQGKLWQKKYKMSSKTIFPIYLYYDDCEARNALGSHAGEEKLGDLYASLACLPSNISAKLYNIFLCTIVHTKIFNKVGPERIFKKTVADLIALSAEGITIKINEKEKVIYFEFVLILGDNLALNDLCGFSGSFIAHQ